MAAPFTVPALAGEPLDALAWRALGTTSAVEQILEANTGLAALGPLLPEGQLVTLPATASAPAEPELVQLWN